MQDFRKLDVWVKSHQLTLKLYQWTASFPRTEQFGLTAQIRRASASIPANISEGCGRAGNKEMAHFLQISFGSACELEYHLLLAHDLGFLGDAQYQSVSEELVSVKRMLAALINKVKVFEVKLTAETRKSRTENREPKTENQE